MVIRRCSPRCSMGSSDSTMMQMNGMVRVRRLKMNRDSMMAQWALQKTSWVWEIWRDLTDWRFSMERQSTKWWAWNCGSDFLQLQILLELSMFHVLVRFGRRYPFVIFVPHQCTTSHLSEYQIPCDLWVILNFIDIIQSDTDTSLSFQHTGFGSGLNRTHIQDLNCGYLVCSLENLRVWLMP